MNNFLIMWDSNRSCYEFLGGFFTYKEAIRRRNQVKSHFNYKGQDLDIVSAYELGYLEAISWTPQRLKNTMNSKNSKNLNNSSNLIRIRTIQSYQIATCSIKLKPAYCGLKFSFLNFLLWRNRISAIFQNFLTGRLWVTSPLKKCATFLKWNGIASRSRSMNTIDQRMLYERPKTPVKRGRLAPFLLLLFDLNVQLDWFLAA